MFHFPRRAQALCSLALLLVAALALSAPKNILGTEADSKQDGSLYKMLRFPKVGYWVSYTRTAGDSPMTLVTMQKIQ